MNPIAEEIIESFDTYEVHHRVQENEDNTQIIAEVLVDYTAFTVIILVEHENGEVSMRVPYFVRHLKKDRRTMLRAANEMNNKYRYCKFTVNPEVDSVMIEFDFPKNTGNIGDAVTELMQRFIQIGKESYPYFMRALWEKKPPLSPPAGTIVFHDVEV